MPSALCRSEVDGAPLLRVYNASVGPAAATLELGHPAVATRVDLQEQPVGPPHEGASHHLDLRPWEIATLRLG